MRLEIRLFAIARQRVGKPSLILDFPDGSTVADLRRALADSPLADLIPRMMIAVDSEYADDAHPLRADSEVALIPPVSGGLHHDG